MTAASPPPVVPPSWRRREARLAWALVLPALGIIAAVAVFPIGWTVWESLHLHDLRMPWLGRPYVGLANYAAAMGDRRFWSAVGHTGVFAALSVSIELTLGLVLALGLDRVRRAAGLVRTVVLLPWALPTVVVALASVVSGATRLASRASSRAASAVVRVRVAARCVARSPVVAAVARTSPAIAISTSATSDSTSAEPASR